MQVDEMTCEGCVTAVKRTVQRRDPTAEVDVDLAHGRMHLMTNAQAVDVANALTKAGYEARAMTG